MDSAMDHILFPSQNNFSSDGDLDDKSALLVPRDDEKPHKKVHDPDSTDKGASAKKSRHRHRPDQLQALNELYEKNEHPSLDDRSELAERLGM